MKGLTAVTFAVLFDLIPHSPEVIAQLPEARSETTQSAVGASADKKDHHILVGGFLRKRAIVVWDLGCLPCSDHFRPDRVVDQAVGCESLLEDASGEDEHCGEQGDVSGEEEDEGGLDGCSEQEPG